MKDMGIGSKNFLLAMVFESSPQRGSVFGEGDLKAGEPVEGVFPNGRVRVSVDVTDEF